MHNRYTITFHHFNYLLFFYLKDLNITSSSGITLAGGGVLASLTTYMYSLDPEEYRQVYIIAKNQVLLASMATPLGLLTCLRTDPKVYAVHLQGKLEH